MYYILVFVSVVIILTVADFLLGRVADVLRKHAEVREAALLNDSQNLFCKMPMVPVHAAMPAIRSLTRAGGHDLA